MSMKTNVKMKALKCAFPHTIPIMTGFLFLGMSYGIYMHVSGFSFWYPMLMAMTIFAGSVEFVCVNFLLGAFNPLQAFIVTLILNARHIFYGISMLDRFKGMGWKKDDYFRIIYWHNELGMFEEAKKAKEFLLSFDICTKNQFDINAKQIKNIILEKSRQFGTDLIAFNDFGGGCCSECAKMRGRVYSISGKSKVFPKLPEYVLENGNFHPGCRCIMSLFFENETELFYKGERANAKALSRRPWVDDRDEKERQLYEEYLNNIQKDIAHIKKREEYSIKKGIAQREFDQILMYLPELAPKSITGYMRMKTSKSKNFIKLFNAAKEKGIDIKTD